MSSATAGDFLNILAYRPRVFFTLIVISKWKLTRPERIQWLRSAPIYNLKTQS